MSVDLLIGMTQEQFWKGIRNNLKRILKSQPHPSRAIRRLSKALGFSRAKLDKILSGKKPFFKIGTAVKIADYFKIPLQAVIRPNYQGPFTHVDRSSTVSTAASLNNFKVLNEAAARAFSRLIDRGVISTQDYYSLLITTAKAFEGRIMTESEALDAFTFALSSNVLAKHLDNMLFR